MAGAEGDLRAGGGYRRRLRGIRDPQQALAVGADGFRGGPAGLSRGRRDGALLLGPVRAGAAQVPGEGGRPSARGRPGGEFLAQAAPLFYGQPAARAAAA